MYNLTAVHIPTDVYFVCLSHALTTSKEEIMGLLLGEWKLSSTPTAYIAEVTSLLLLTRLDKRQDRVEIAPEQLIEATQHAERISKETGRPTGIIGWYHSHPNITVFPSHVDVKTQADQQMMDSRFFGLIFSCFNRNADNSQRLQLTAFQSTSMPPYTHLEVPIQIIPSATLVKQSLETLVSIPEILFWEARNAFLRACGINVDGNTAGITGTRKRSEGTLVDLGVTGFDNTANRTAIPTQIPTSPHSDYSDFINFGSPSSLSQPFLSSQSSLLSPSFSEVEKLTSDIGLPKTSMLYYSCTYLTGLMHIVDKILGPLIVMMKEKQKENEASLAYLQSEKTRLLDILSNPSSISPSTPPARTSSRTPSVSSSLAFSLSDAIANLDFDSQSFMNNSSSHQNPSSASNSEMFNSILIGGLGSGSGGSSTSGSISRNNDNEESERKKRDAMMLIDLS